MFWAYKGRPISDLAKVCQEYIEKATKENGQEMAAATKRNRIRYLVSACRQAWKHHGIAEHDLGERVLLPVVRNERQY